MGKIQGKLKDIPSCPGYKITNSGDVFHGSKQLRGTISRGRHMVKLYGLPRQVSRLVALAWIPNPNNYPCVLHNDNDPLNNHYKNLRWGTYKMNSQQMVEEGRAKGGPNTTKLNGVDVQRIRNSKLDNWALANYYDVSYSHIVSIKNGSRRNNI